MSGETSAALWGAVVGGFLTFLASYFVELKRARESRRHAISLFKFINREWRITNTFSNPNKNSYKKDLEILSGVFDQIRPAIIGCGCANIVENFLKYNASFNEVRYLIQNGSPGQVSYPVQAMSNAYQKFESETDAESCCE